MAMRMLIDARHPEETRVAVIEGNRIEEFDFESAQKQQLKGNIYLAKVTRVEPSLQAAFVEYGGNRHGFLAFSEIHPDYYQIPKEDREALLREEREAAEAHHAELEAADDANTDDGDDDNGEDHDGEDRDADGDDRPASPTEVGEHDHHEEQASEALRAKRHSIRKRYKIQEVIKRRQVMLVQVVKEERGNKGAALTTYLSLAGRYCVFMPNTNHGGGISRKISSQMDRKRLKSIVSELKLPQGMGCIIRTAGLSRTKAEIKRDFDYLTRLWDEIREKTLASTAPSLIHEDSDLIKRAIRDIYNRDVGEVLVDGEDGYKAAKNFMKLLMPSHAKRVQQYVDPVPLFQRYQVEPQLAAMYQPVVQLKSGGYLVINPTEALVSIDINSGKSTREHNIEETAVKTNIEAAREIARQLRLRDMAGLVVIDFIDMDMHGNNRKVEKALKEALKNDRARIQVGRISTFGLLEMSRQRLRTGVLEASTHVCPTCDGAGIVRTLPSATLGALRILEAEALRGKHSHFKLALPAEVAMHMLNAKRSELGKIEELYGVIIELVPNDDLNRGEHELEVGGPPPTPRVNLSLPVAKIEIDDVVEVEVEDEDEASDDDDAVADDEETRDRTGTRDGRSRRRRRGRGRDRERDRDSDSDRKRGRDSDRKRDRDSERRRAENDGSEAGETAPATESDGAEAETKPAGDSERGPRKRRRRGRRGGRRRSEDGLEIPATGEPDGANVQADAAAAGTAAGDVSDAAPDDVDAAPARRGRRRSGGATEPAADPSGEATEAEGLIGNAEAADTGEPKAARPGRRRRVDTGAPDVMAEAAPEPVPPSAQPAATAASDTGAEAESLLVEVSAGSAEDNTPRRRGWWQKTFG
jgi:ribonuclease E